VSVDGEILKLGLAANVFIPKILSTLSMEKIKIFAENLIDFMGLLPSK